MHGAALILLALAAPPGTFDAGGVALGASEAEVQKVFKTAQCRPMAWKTDAADRRCDDATAFAGAEARITFYLRRERVQAFDVRFGASDVERIAGFLKARYGAPLADGIEEFDQRGEKRRVRKLRWKKGEDQAVLTAPEERGRAELNVWRGNFDTEVYNIR
jgi:hypothetical protein